MDLLLGLRVLRDDGRPDPSLPYCRCVVCLVLGLGVGFSKNHPLTPALEVSPGVQLVHQTLSSHCTAVDEIDSGFTAGFCLRCPSNLPCVWCL